MFYITQIELWRIFFMTLEIEYAIVDFYSGNGKFNKQPSEAVYQK